LRKKYLVYAVILSAIYASGGDDTKTHTMTLKNDEKEKRLKALRRREHNCRQGLLRSDRTGDGRLAVYTYTDKCVFDRAWDDITLNSRGHIFDLETGECVAWAFPKFFNLGENPEVLPHVLPWNRPYEVTEKMDGWLGVLYRHEGIYKVATRGSFTSEGATWATARIQDYNLTGLPDDVTLCFEIITPEQRIILDYGLERRLVILGAFDRHSGTEYPHSRVEQWSRTMGLPMVPLLPHLSLEDLLDRQKELEHFEGFVIRFYDDRRVKMKTRWYLNIARILTHLSPISVWEVLENGKIPIEFLVQIPEELRPLAEGYKNTIETQYARVMRDIEQTTRPLIERFGSDRRQLALEMNKRKKELGHRLNAAFLILDGKLGKLDKLVKRLIYPKGNEFVSDARLLSNTRDRTGNTNC
jgi:RNA ligase